MTKEEAREMLIEELEVDLEDALKEVERTRGAHVRFHLLARQYEAKLLVAQATTGDEAWAPNCLWTRARSTQTSFTCGTYRILHVSMITIGERLHWRIATIDSDRDACGSQGPWLEIVPFSESDITALPKHYWLGEVPEYTEVMSRARAFIPLRGNQVPDPYRFYLDRMGAEDDRYESYADHQCVMRQSGYQQTIPRHPSISAPIAMTHRQLDDVFVDFEHHMVPDEARATKSDVDWSCVDGYITWYYRVSYPYLIPTAPRSPPRPAHEEILQTH
ncbi:uncharacterized protein LOC131604458 [Vicia villosa]|uniref:uncharacterized protein LOC131604458 n=1 Tax=Vicia villosa TaxID=3911 RepID=UPI00273A8769|nr:uncharacterized protein LOC131604458 [Vicia villosa]